MEFRSINPNDYGAARQFLAEVGWQHRVADPEKFKTMLENTARIVVAVEGSRVLGFARAICDDVSNGYITMVAVDPERRREGIGSELVRRLIKDDPNITWILRAGRGSETFWEKNGFRPSAVAMERCRQELH